MRRRVHPHASQKGGAIMEENRNLIEELILLELLEKKIRKEVKKDE